MTFNIEKNRRTYQLEVELTPFSKKTQISSHVRSEGVLSNFHHIHSTGKTFGCRREKNTIPCLTFQEAVVGCSRLLDQLPIAKSQPPVHKKITQISFTRTTTLPTPNVRVKLQFHTKIVSSVFRRCPKERSSSISSAGA